MPAQREMLWAADAFLCHINWLAKAFDLVSRHGLFHLLKKVQCPIHLLSIISSFHENMKGAVSYDRDTSEPFNISSGMKQGCVLRPTLFGIFFSAAAILCTLVIHWKGYSYTVSLMEIFLTSHFWSKIKVRQVIIRELLFADDAVLVPLLDEQLFWPPLTQYTYTQRTNHTPPINSPRHGRHFSRSQSHCHSHHDRSSSFRRHTLCLLIQSLQQLMPHFGWWMPPSPLMLWHQLA